ncbi:hypothetical protein QTP86_019493 [Hemibagrus guttatus]|nr:hypothetical protein QTP86_019493 [Hemibagrus guttatus]
MESVSEKFLTLKMALLLGLASLRRVGDLQALSVAPTCLEFAPDMSKAILHPRAGYVPKVPRMAGRLVILQAFCLLPHESTEQERLHLLCPVSSPLRLMSTAPAHGISPPPCLFALGARTRVGCELEEKERFWSELDEMIESIPMGERVVIGTDFNGHVGEGNRCDEELMGKFGVKERNLEGHMVVDFAKWMDMAVVNTYFQKREEHRVTYKSGRRRT